MIEHLAVGGALAKRLVEDPPNWKLPSYSWAIFVVDFILLLPLFFLVFYTFNQLFPTLAAVEDPLQEYEAVPIDEDGTPKDDDEAGRGRAAAAAAADPGRPVTASLRATHRLLRSLGGRFSSFRGLGYSLVVAMLMGVTVRLLSAFPFVPSFVAGLLTMLALAPLSTTWTHIVITPASARPFFRRFPPARKVYAATWLPTVILWLVANVTMLLLALLARAVNLSVDSLVQRGLSGSDSAKLLCLVGVATALKALLVIPAETALFRVQASLLPADEDTVVPFDRSFGGRVEPEVVSGKGFATFGAALATISGRSWARIYLQRVKLFAVSSVAFAAVGGLLAVQALLLRKMCDGKKDGEHVGALKCF